MIKNVADMPTWEKSEAYFVWVVVSHNFYILLSEQNLQEYLGFVLALNDAIKGKSNSLLGVQISEGVQKTIHLLDRLDKMIDETPPIKQPQRFGNQAFKTWYEKLKDVCCFKLLFNFRIT